MRRNVTDIVQRYRLARRHIWNSCFWVDPSLRDWESVAAFRKLKLPLFQAVVADQLELEARDTGRYHYRSIEIGASGQEYGRHQRTFGTNEIRLTLVDFFDWTAMDYVDLRYYVVIPM